MQRQDRRGVAYALSAATLWGIAGAVAASAFASLTPAQVAESRAVLAAVILLPIAAARTRLSMRGEGRLLVVLGAILVVVTVTYYWSIQRLGVGPGVTVQFLGPLLVLVWMAVVQRRPVSRVAWWAGAGAIVGVTLVTEAWRIHGVDWVGIAAGLAAAAMFAAYLIVGERLGERLSVTTVITWGFTFAAIFWLVLLPPWRFPFDIGPAAWGQVVWIAVAGTVVPFLVEMAALQRISAGVVGIIATTEPVVAAVAGWVLLSQRLSVGQMLGVVFVVAAVATVQRRGVTVVEPPYEAVR